MPGWPAGLWVACCSRTALDSAAKLKQYGVVSRKPLQKVVLLLTYAMTSPLLNHGLVTPKGTGKIDTPQHLTSYLVGQHS